MCKDKVKIFVCFLLLFSFLAKSQSQTPSSDTRQLNEFTLYIMPTLLPLDWSSPRSIHKSTINCYLRTIHKRDNYLLGHVAVSLKSPLLDKPLLTTQTSCGMKEKKELIFKKKIGLAILGVALPGRMEPSLELIHKLKVYAKREKLTFIRYKISEKAAKRMIDFVKLYSQKTESNFAQCDFYGGSFWPRYKNEGAGCSSFGITLLDLVGIKSPEFEDWKIKVNIPMNLIGGSLNEGKKIKSKDINRTRNWNNGNGTPNVNFVKYGVYDPSLMYNWVKQKLKDRYAQYQVVCENGIYGLQVDATAVDFDEYEPIFYSKTDSDFFAVNHSKNIPFIHNKIPTSDSISKIKIPETLKLDSIVLK